MLRLTDPAERFAWDRERFPDEAPTLARLDQTLAIGKVTWITED